MSDLPFGHTSVMSNRAPAAPGELDYFPTPPWAARAGGELIQRLDPGPWSCWEPACGEGHMAHGLLDYFEGGVFASDIFDYGYGSVRDFLADDGGAPSVDWIVSNPPFIKGEAFVRRAWPLARRGVAMLLRLVFLEGAARYRLFYEDCLLSAVAPFAERVPMVKGRWDPNASSATAYAWFIWIKPETGRAPDGVRVVPIAPGAKARLTRDSDRRFIPAGPELFGEGDE